MGSIGVGGTWVDVGGGFDVWLPLYVFLSFLLVLSSTGWYLTIRRACAAIALGMFWSWSVNRLSVIPAAALAVLIAAIANMIVRRRGRPTRTR
jgi:membrane protein implicated in regulation of membrane protease activity